MNSDLLVEFRDVLYFLGSPASPFPNLKPTEAALAALLIIGLNRLDTIKSSLQQIHEMLADAAASDGSS